MIIAFPAMADSAQLCETSRTCWKKSKGDCDVFVEVTSEGMLVRVALIPLEGPGQRRNRISVAESGLRSQMGRLCCKTGRGGARLSNKLSMAEETQIEYGTLSDGV